MHFFFHVAIQNVNSALSFNIEPITFRFMNNMYIDKYKYMQNYISFLKYFQYI